MSLLSITDLNFCETVFSDYREVKGGEIPAISWLNAGILPPEARSEILTTLSEINPNQEDTGNSVITWFNFNLSESSSGTTP